MLKRDLNFILTINMGDVDLIGQVAGVGNYNVGAGASMP
jgi:hypothetical protein